MRNAKVLFLIGLALLVLPVPSAWAGDNCQAFRALLRGAYPTPVHLRDGDTFGGGIWASLGGQELLFGQFAGNDGTETDHGMMILAKGGSYKYDFGANGTFTTEITTAVGTFPPGKIGIGYYMGTAKIARGTGRFQSASGNIQVTGPFLGWFEGENLEVLWNAELSGTICNVSAP